MAIVVTARNPVALGTPSPAHELLLVAFSTKLNPGMAMPEPGVPSPVLASIKSTAVIAVIEAVLVIAQVQGVPEGEPNVL